MHSFKNQKNYNIYLMGTKTEELVKQMTDFFVQGKHVAEELPEYLSYEQAFLVEEYC